MLNMASPRDYRAEYARRIAKSKKVGLSSAQARGHAKPNETLASAVESKKAWTVTVYLDDPPRPVTLITDRPSSRRAGRYMQLTRQLREARIAPSEFR